MAQLLQFQWQGCATFHWDVPFFEGTLLMKAVLDVTPKHEISRDDLWTYLVHHTSKNSESDMFELVPICACVLTCPCYAGAQFTAFWIVLDDFKSANADPCADGIGGSSAVKARAADLSPWGVFLLVKMGS